MKGFATAGAATANDKEIAGSIVASR